MLFAKKQRLSLCAVNGRCSYFFIVNFINRMFLFGPAETPVSCYCDFVVNHSASKYMLPLMNHSC